MKRVKDWNLCRYPNGTYCLTFNTVERWEEVHRANETTYIFGPDDDEEVVELVEFLPAIERGVYLSSKSQDKYQVWFYFIPFKNEEVDKIEWLEVKSIV